MDARSTLARGLVLGLLIAWCGCTDGGRAIRPTEPSPTQPQSWAEQVAAVRAGGSHEIRVMDSTITERDWDALREGCQQLEVLDIEHLDVPESDLNVLAGLTQLRQLRLGFPVTDAGLARLAEVSSLRILNLPRGEFTGTGLAELVRLPHLELLRFRSPRVTDSGLDEIARMPALKFLHLIDVPVTDAGLRALHGLTKLESFYLDGGRCTDEGLSELLRALPELHLHRDQLHLPDDPHAHPH
jgi:hypothetical protein